MKKKLKKTLKKLKKIIRMRLDTPKIRMEVGEIP